MQAISQSQMFDPKHSTAKLPNASQTPRFTFYPGKTHDPKSNWLRGKKPGMRSRCFLIPKWFRVSPLSENQDIAWSIRPSSACCSHLRCPRLRYLIFDFGLHVNQPSILWAPGILPAPRQT
ncbi:hypothetical protein ABW21_db0209160 [Orbilia brochopaga]|nr:hypothetical protein ABW21_db0209160 [Drechslerella brochopaga]